MDLEDYYADFSNSVKTRAAADGSFTAQAFTLEAAERLSLADEVDSLSTYSFETTGARGKRIAVDGSDLDDEQNQVVLAISDYRQNEGIEALTTTEAKRAFSALEAFAQCALDGTYSDLFDPATQAHQDAEEIRARHRDGKLDKIRLYLLSNARLSDKIKALPSSSIGDVEVEFHIWGLDRFHRVETSELGREEIDIDLTEWTKKGIPALEASTPGSEVRTLLLVIPGDVVANIYDRYGSRVLESNVRSFLTTRVKVNKGILGTLVQSPELFLPFNNGITATASGITASGSGDIRVITGIRDLQIVNGGQTTASLYFARRNDNTDLSRSFVQMKLIVVDDERAQDLVPRISRYANTQNNVNESDFFSNHAFHQRLEEKSRRILTPKRAGEHHETKWFYERVRGQFLNEKSKRSTRDAKKFAVEYPRDQLITKTDAAKFLLTWDQQPHIVRTGTQKSFAVFAKSISEAWNTSELTFDDRYFRDLVAKAIIFKTLESAVSRADWYKAEKGYRADIVTYAIARFALAASEFRNGSEFNLELIWQRQSLPDEILEELVELAESVREVLVSGPVKHVTEWSKRAACWEAVKQVPFDIPPEHADWIVSTEELSERKREGKKTQKMDNGIDAEVEVLTLGPQYWVKLRDFGRQVKGVSDTDLSFIAYATGERGRGPSEKQCARLLQIRDRMVELGFEGR